MFSLSIRSSLQGMEYLHSKHIVHFDLKSANLLLGYKDRRAICKVADFGLSKQKRDTYVSNVSSQRGTLPWIAPEIIKTPHEVTEKVCTGAFLELGRSGGSLHLQLHVLKLLQCSCFIRLCGPLDSHAHAHKLMSLVDRVNDQAYSQHFQVVSMQAITHVVVRL